MTWLLLGILSAIVVYLLRDDLRAHDDMPRVERRNPLQPRMEGLVHYIGFAGSHVLLESPRGVELPLDGEDWTLDDALIYLAEVDSL